MGRILLLRHGQSTWNAQGRWQGWADPPLSAAGRTQAAAAAVLLADEGIEAVASSDLRRARETADIIAAALGHEHVLIEPGIRERDVGEWSGLTRADIDARWPGMLTAWRTGRLRSLPGGEGDINDRVIAGIDRILGQVGDKVTLAVTHGGVIRGLVRHLGGDPDLVANLGGRWIEGVPGRLRLGPAILFDTDEGNAPTTVL